MSIKDVIRKNTPSFLLEWNRKRKKKMRNAQLQQQVPLSKDSLLKDLRAIGIVPGDILLVHSSQSSIGKLENGPKTLVDALMEAVGPDGHILMPTSPNNVYQLDYIRNNKVFDVLNTPSNTGKITEYFRTLPNAVRSLSPTEPVSAIGPRAKYFVEGHFNQLTPYTKDSPFYKVSKEKGKLLYIGVTLAMAGTNLHTLEDAVDFKFPVYYPEIFEIKIIDEKGNEHLVNTKVHDPEWSKKRKCDDLIPVFKENGALQEVRIGQAQTLLCDAEKFFEVMLDQYNEKGVTMYTPKGS